jgi:predicted O-methyltransferase YrrM
MALTTTIKRVLNRALAPANLKLDTLTSERAEHLRLLELDRNGHFDRPISRVPASFALPPAALIETIRAGTSRFATFVSEDRNPVGYSFDNSYFSSPDAEVLYAMLRWKRPRWYVEIGSGHSTRVARQAVLDGELPTRITCIDPAPRREVSGIADEIHRERVESPQARTFLDELLPGDVLFIDSSHDIAPGNDVMHIFLHVLPSLAPGVIIHIHDVFLPYDYPRDWVLEHRLSWTEQYLVAALLSCDSRYESIWPGYWLQRTWPEFAALLPNATGRRAQSLWLTAGSRPPAQKPPGQAPA